MIALTLVLAVRLAQQGEPAPQNPVLEGVAVQAGEALVTLSELERVVKRVFERQMPASTVEEERARVKILRDLWVVRLEEQAGEELGLDPAQIERISRANLEEQRDKQGLAAYLAELEQRGTDALSEEVDRKRTILRHMWEYKAVGQPFAAFRATRDAEIRPGELRAIYAENRDRLAPETVQLCWLMVASEAAGSPEAARESCAAARERALSGEDMELLVEELGAAFRDTRGVTPFLPPKSLRDPALVPFAETAEVAAISEVLPITNPRTGAPDPGLGYQIAELRERNVPEVPPFEDPEVQRVLREQFSQQREELILNREREKLRREFYAWVNPLLTGPAPAAGPQPARP